ncbi:MAG: HAMP domain-containing protein, partial [Candidatus Protistobacter heckmanni]|nr:HAMP domain-containing protein [Candidatus Protistobacter heckmanni]
MASKGEPGAEKVGGVAAPAARSRVGRVVFPVLAAGVVVIALLLGLLAAASANTEFFDKYYSLLYQVNLVIGVLLVLIVGALTVTLVLRLARGRFGMRLMAKLGFFFAVVGVLPGALVYLVSLQFVSRSIESWFDVKVESALEAGLNLGRATIDSSLSQLQDKARFMAEQLSAARSVGSDAGLALTLSRLRDQLGVQGASLIGAGSRVVANASSDYKVVPDLPTPAMLRQAEKTRGGFGAVENGSEPGDSVKQPFRLRVIVAVPSSNTAQLDIGRGLLGFGLGARTPEQNLYLQLVQAVPENLARNADAVQEAYAEYQAKALGRTGLRKMYIGTLTLTLLLVVFLALMLALLLGSQLARPLLLLLQGTKAVAEGDLTRRLETRGHDELSLLTRQFNQMTSQLAEARSAVEMNRAALEHSKAYLESVLANLTAGVFVLDHRFRLSTANPGAERIFRQPFAVKLGLALEALPGLAEFGQAVRQAFAEQQASSAAGGADHWQKQIELQLPGEEEPLTLLVRGARLPEPDSARLGFVVVFDDITEVMSAQRSVAWAEVARRLAHEIKNPLTPIQLSAERLQMKLADKLGEADAAMLARGARTIVNQVEAMKQMVNDFRDYARTQPLNLEALDLNALIAEVLNLYGIDEPGRSPHEVIEVKLAADLPNLEGDRTQLRQVIHNLLQNALDAVVDNAA